jgi:hypothetical protein
MVVVGRAVMDGFSLIVLVNKKYGSLEGSRQQEFTTKDMKQTSREKDEFLRVLRDLRGGSFFMILTNLSISDNRY